MLGIMRCSLAQLAQVPEVKARMFGALDSSAVVIVRKDDISLVLLKLFHAWIHKLLQKMASVSQCFSANDDLQSPCRESNFYCDNPFV